MRTAPSRVHSPATPNMRRTLSLRIFQQQRRLMATAMAAQPTSQPSPTSIPRAPGVKDGPWTALDSAAVEQALADARELAQRRHAPKHGPVLLATTPDEMHALVTRAVQHLGGEGADNAPVPAYRSKQLLDAILKGTRSMDDITTVPKTLRAALKAYGVVCALPSGAAAVCVWCCMLSRWGMLLRLSVPIMCIAIDHVFVDMVPMRAARCPPTANRPLQGPPHCASLRRHVQVSAAAARRLRGGNGRDPGRCPIDSMCEQSSGVPHAVPVLCHWQGRLCTQLGAA